MKKVHGVLDRKQEGYGVVLIDDPELKYFGEYKVDGDRVADIPERAVLELTFTDDGEIAELTYLEEQTNDRLEQMQSRFDSLSEQLDK